MNWLELAQRNLIEGNWLAAEVSLETAWASAPEGLERDHATLGRAWLALARGRPDDGYERLLDLNPSLGSPFEEGLLSADEDWERWETAASRANPGYDGLFFARLYLVIGRYCAAIGRFGLAIWIFRRGLALDRSAAGRADAYPLRLFLAAALLERGDLDEARAELDAFQGTSDAALGIYWPMWKELVATWHILAGDYGLAMGILQSVAEWLDFHGLAIPCCRANLNLAYVELLCGVVGRAEDRIRLARRKAAHDGNRDLLAACDAADAVRMQAARDLSVQVLPIASLWYCFGSSAPSPDPGPPPDVPSAGFLTGFHRDTTEFRRRIGSLTGAALERAWERFAAPYAASDSLLVLLENRLTRAMVRQAAGDARGALAEFRQAARALAGLGLRPRLCVTLRLAADCARAAGDDPASDDALSRRLFVQMVDSVPWQERVPFVMSRVRFADSSLEAEAAKLATHSPRALDRNVIAPALDLLRAAWQTGDWTAAHPSDRIPDAQNLQVDSHTAYLCLLGFKRWMTVILLTNRGAAAWRADLDATAALKLAKEWHAEARALFNSPAGGDTGVLDEVSAEISRVLVLDAIPSLSPEVNQLRIRADGAIRALPAAAWVTKGQRLVEKYAIACDTSFRPPPVTPSAQHILAAPVALAPDGMPAPGAVAELDWLSAVEWIPRARLHILKQRQITRQDFAAALSSASYLHFVGHGVFDPYRPDKSGLVLVPSTGAEELFSLSDIERGSYSGLQHATLIACWGADAYALPGRIPDGIAEAFRRSGARSVLASLWPAAPEAADRLSRAFTHNLANMPRDLALAAAQRAMIAEGRSTVHWAGWQLIGDAGRLPVTNRA